MPGWARSSVRTACADTTSPPVETSRTPPKMCGACSASTRKYPAVACTLVTWWAAISRPRSTVSMSPAGTSTSRPPCSSVVQISYVEASKA